MESVRRSRRQRPGKNLRKRDEARDLMGTILRIVRAFCFDFDQSDIRNATHCKDKISDFA